MTGAGDPRQLLQSELARRCERNPKYSLRAFARALGMSHTVLSLVLSGKRPLSKGATLKVADALSLDPAERERLLARRRASSPASLPEKGELVRQLSLDTFELISDWHHYAILSLLELPRARFEARWIASRLGISQVQAKLAIERLKRLGLVECVAKDRWRQAGQPIRVENAVSTAATRKFHRQLLERAVASLDNDPAEARDFTSMTFVLDPRALDHARERIRVFRRELVRELESTGNPSAVYQFTLQLFPVTKAGASEEKS